MNGVLASQKSSGLLGLQQLNLGRLPRAGRNKR